MITRRQFLQGMLGVTAVTAFTGIYTFRIEPYWVKIEYLPLPVRNLPAALVGKTLIQLSDLHIGSKANWHTIGKELQRIQQLAPDFVVYTGDFVSYTSAVQFDQLYEIIRHTPLGRLGTVAILGNHDYGHGWSQSDVASKIGSILTDVNITLLRNEVRSFGGLHIAGIDDYWGTNYAPEQVTAVLDPAHPTIVLCHNPDVVDLPVWHGYQGWILAGHTHGGQVKPPFLPPPVLPVQNKRYTAGVFDVGNGRFLYINRGLGNLMSVRFNVRPEITIFTLTAA